MSEDRDSYCRYDVQYILALERLLWDCSVYSLCTMCLALSMRLSCSGLDCFSAAGSFFLPTLPSSSGLLVSALSPFLYTVPYETGQRKLVRVGMMDAAS